MTKSFCYQEHMGASRSRVITMQCSQQVIRLTKMKATEQLKSKIGTIKSFFLLLKFYHCKHLVLKAIPPGKTNRAGMLNKQGERNDRKDHARTNFPARFSWDGTNISSVVLMARRSIVNVTIVK